MVITWPIHVSHYSILMDYSATDYKPIFNLPLLSCFLSKLFVCFFFFRIMRKCNKCNMTELHQQNCWIWNIRDWGNSTIHCIYEPCPILLQVQKGSSQRSKEESSWKCCRSLSSITDYYFYLVRFWWLTIASKIKTKLFSINYEAFDISIWSVCNIYSSHFRS